MTSYSSGQNSIPVVKGVSYLLGHVPNMIRHGSKPSREIAKDPSLLNRILKHLHPYPKAVAYPHNQIFIAAVATGLGELGYNRLFLSPQFGLLVVPAWLNVVHHGNN